MKKNRCEISRRHKSVHDAYCRGDLEALRMALDDPPDFPNCHQPFAIYWSPIAFLSQLLRLGADANYRDSAGFPSLIAALSARRPDSNKIVELLLQSGADVGQRGVNDWTPLHYAVVERNLAAVKLLLASGADPHLATRIDDCTSPLENAEAVGFTEAAVMMREAAPGTARERDSE